MKRFVVPCGVAQAGYMLKQFCPSVRLSQSWIVCSDRTYRPTFFTAGNIQRRQLTEDITHSSGIYRSRLSTNAWQCVRNDTRHGHRKSYIVCLTVSQTSMPLSLTEPFLRLQQFSVVRLVGLVQSRKRQGEEPRAAASSFILLQLRLTWFVRRS